MSNENEYEYKESKPDSFTDIDLKKNTHSHYKKLLKYLPFLLIIAFTVIAYLPAIQGGFIWDDDSYVSKNSLLKTPDGLWKIWTTTENPQYYPMVFTSFWIEYHLWGLNPMGYHVVNVVLHILNALLIVLLLQKLGVRGAWWIGAIFALHPVHVESVAWITERKNVLSGVFYLLAIHGFLHFEEAKKWKWYFGSMAFYTLALLSKTVTCSLPVALLLIHWFKRSKISLRNLYTLIPFLLLGLVMGLLTVWYEAHIVGAKGEEWDLSIFERFLLAGRIIWFYAIKLVWPVNLTFIYPRWEMDASDLWQWFPFLGVLITGFAFWRFRSWLGRGPAVSLAFFVVTLFPALGFFKTYPMRFSFVADHFQYLASLGIITLVVSSITMGIEKRGWVNATSSSLRKYLWGGSGFMVLVVLVTLTWEQGYIYKDIETLWRNTLSKNPGAWMAHDNLGLVLLKQNKINEAIKHHRQAIKLRPNNEVAYNNLGLAFYKLGKPDDAIENFKQALKINPNLEAFYINLGLAQAKTGMWEEAAKTFKRAIEIGPASVIAYNNFGLALSKLGRFEEAAQVYRKALSIKPAFDMTHNNLGVVLFRQGKVDMAIEHFKKARDINPANAKAHYGLGITLAQKGKRDEAIKHYRQALKINPSHADAHYYLGLGLLKQGNVDGAVKHLRQTLSIKPSYIKANYILATALTIQGKLDEAIKEYQAVLSLKPDHVQAMVNLGNLHQQKSQWEKAKDIWQKAIKIAPEDFKARMNLGSLYLKENQFSNAIEEFSAASRISKDNPVVYYYIAVSLEGLKDKEAAIKYYQKLINIVGPKGGQLVKEATKRLHRLKQVAVKQ